MIGKIIKIEDYKFVYGQEVMKANVFGCFKDKKNTNKYIVYSYDNKKIFYGKAYINKNKITVMISKDDSTATIEKFIKCVFDNNINDDFDIIGIDNVNSLEIIDEKEYLKEVDINKLYELTIPKKKVSEEDNSKKSKGFSFGILGMILLILFTSLFFYINPETLIGDNHVYICSKKIKDISLPADIQENLKVTFNGIGKFISNTKTTIYTFNDNDYYNKFKNESLFYQYIKDGDAYKFDDENKVYKVIKNIDKKDISSEKEDDLIDNYTEQKYNCILQEEE